MKGLYYRIDGAEVVSGKAIYGTDVRHTPTLYGKLVRSSEAHAFIIRIDTERAIRLKGVRTIITAEDLPNRNIQWLVDDQPLLARRKVRYVGEPIAAVAAVDEDTAEEAATLIEIEYERIPALLNIEESIRSEILIHEKKSKFSPLEDTNLKNVCSYTKIKRGDITRAFSQADIVIEDEFEAAAVHQAYLEPHAAMATVGSDGVVTIWTSTQSPFIIRSAVSWLLDIPIHKIRVIATRTGGGFGAKLAPLIEPYCAALALKTGSPVKMVFSRYEEMAAGTPQSSFKILIKSGVSRSGTILARYVKVLMDAGAYAGDAPVDVNIALLITTGAYKVEHVYGEGYAIYTNKPRCGAFRSVGAPQATFALESHMERIADELQMDPLEFRLKNLWDDGYLTPWGQKIDKVGLGETLRRVADKIGWGKIKLEKNKGIGLACGVTLTAAMHPSSVRIRMNEDSSITVFAGAAEIGTGSMLGGLPIIVARELDIPIEMVIIAPSDTDIIPFNDGAQGSSTTYVAGNSALLAARALRSRLFEIASEMLESRPEDLVLSNGKIWVRDAPDKVVTFGDIVKYAHYKLGIEVEGYSGHVMTFPPYNPDAWEGFTYVPSLIDPTYTAHAAIVEVDEETGHTRIIRYVAGQDSGRVIWRNGLEGQITGGLAQGIGFTLFEELKFNEKGNVVNPTLMDYLVPSAAEIPPIEIVLVEDFPGKGPLGSKGGGEAPVVPPPAAIANAIYRATGWRPMRIPITPEDVWRGLKYRKGFQK
jgi:CO/xanthine dehydrogenase Mo-binding subunit